MKYAVHPDYISKGINRAYYYTDRNYFEIIYDNGDYEIFTVEEMKSSYYRSVHIMYLLDWYWRWGAGYRSFEKQPATNKLITPEEAKNYNNRQSTVTINREYAAWWYSTGVAQQLEDSKRKLLLL